MPMFYCDYHGRVEDSDVVGREIIEDQDDDRNERIVCSKGRECVKGKRAEETTP